jgi:Ca-activated chloride channel family protein
LEVTLNKVNVVIQDQYAVTRVDQEFYNPNPRSLEGTFLFPLPRGAHLNKFTMEIDGQPVEAELLAADKARGIYEEIVRKLKDPALLEYAGRDLLKVRIFPIEPHAQKRIHLSYAQLLPSENGSVQYLFPLNTEKFSAKPLKTVSLKIEIESPRPLKSIYSPSHKVEVRRQGDHKATVGYEASDLKPDTDFLLFFARDEQEIGLNLLTQKADGDEGYFLLLATPSAETKPGQVMPKDVVFVLDTSGSMAGAKLAQAKKALAFCAENLNAEDRFEILRFSTEVESLFGSMKRASAEDRAQAQAFVEKLKPIGGTAIHDALVQALALRGTESDRPFMIIFLTDGRPTIGTVDEDQIVTVVTKQKQNLTRIFCFGIGTDINTHLLDRITEETGAASQYVLPEEDLEVKVSHFFTRIKEPVLAGLKLHFPENIRLTKIYPSPLPDLFKGDQLVVAGRYSGHGRGTIEIEGSLSGETRRFRYDVEIPDTFHEHDFIPRLWATRRVGYLLDEIRMRGENQELKDEVTTLARQYGIVTPYTAYLIIEDDRQRGLTQQQQLLPQQFYRADVRQDLSSQYTVFSQNSSGNGAVAGARALSAWKQAEVPSVALSAGNQDALRASPARTWGSAPAAVTAPASSGPTTLATQPSPNRSEEFSPQTRFVSGRTFFLKDGQWTDNTVAQDSPAKRERIQFGSEEYFKFLRNHPEAAPWLALGSSVVFVLNNTVYEIYE